MIATVGFYVNLIRKYLDDEVKENVSTNFWSDHDILDELDNAMYEVINYLYYSKLYHYMQALIASTVLDIRFYPGITDTLYIPLPADCLIPINVGYIEQRGLANDYGITDIPIIRTASLIMNDLSMPYNYENTTELSINLLTDGIRVIMPNNYGTTDPLHIVLCYVKKPASFKFYYGLPQNPPVVPGDFPKAIYNAIVYLAIALLLIKDHMDGSKFYRHYSEAMLALTSASKNMDYFMQYET